jgi:hypothetical protein
VRSIGGSHGFSAYHNQNINSELLVKNNGTFQTLYGTNLGSDGNWHHVVHVVNPDKTWAFYFDGTLRTTAGPITEFPASDRHGIRVAVGPNAPIDELRLYDYALSASEVAEVYNSTLASMSVVGVFPTPSSIVPKTKAYVEAGISTTSAATCRWSSRPGLDWESLQNHDVTGGIKHSSALKTKPGAVHQVCSRCFDGDTYTTDHCTSFSVEAQPKRWRWW